MSPFEISKPQGPLAASSVHTAGKTIYGEAGPNSRSTDSRVGRDDGISVELRAPVDPGQPPIDTERVSEIRAALKDGTYPIVPARIADAMIAARLAMGLGE